MKLKILLLPTTQILPTLSYLKKYLLNDEFL